MKKRGFIKLTSALIAILMLSLSFVGCVENVARQVDESISEEKESEKNSSDESRELQSSTEKKEEDADEDGDSDDEEGSSLGVVYDRINTAWHY